VIVLESSVTEAVTSELRLRTLKLKNQTAQLENLLRKKEALEIEINRLRKTIKLARKTTHKTVSEQLAAVPQRVEGENLSLFTEELEPEFSSVLSALCEEFNTAEKSYQILEELFSSTNPQ
jgi:hypothetical protein